jgi:alpha-galactosidase
LIVAIACNRLAKHFPSWFTLSIIAICGFFLFAGCSSRTDHVNLIIRNNAVHIRTNALEYILDGRMSTKLHYLANGEPVTLSHPGATHFIVADGRVLRDFIREPGLPDNVAVNSEFGPARQITFVGAGMTHMGTPVQKIHRLLLPERYPNVILSHVQYRNLGTADIWIDSQNAENYVLDASLTGDTDKPEDFWTLQGGMPAQTGDNYVLPLSRGYSRLNTLHTLPDAPGGGIPLLDFWTHRAGLAIGHLELTPITGALPTLTDSDGMTTIEFHQDYGLELRAGETLESPFTFTLLHTGDYYETIRQYVALLADRGIILPEADPADIAPRWNSRSFRRAGTVNRILAMTPKLQELGIGRIAVSHTWMDAAGSWNPRSGSAAGQFATMNEQLHAAGFTSQLEWAPLKLSADAPLYRRQRDLLIQDIDGTEITDENKLRWYCPVLLEVQQRTGHTAEKIVTEWGFDGMQLAETYTAPSCYHPLHNHITANEPLQTIADCYRTVSEATGTGSARPLTLINRGHPPFLYVHQFANTAVVPAGSNPAQLRYHIKLMKALYGPDAPVTAGDLEDVAKHISENVQENISTGMSSMIGAGGIPSTRFLWFQGSYPSGIDRTAVLTGAKEKLYKFWFQLYADRQPARGKYLNLYTLGYDAPEAYAIAQDEQRLYGFYADRWNGPIELRGLESRRYLVYDYVNDQVLGTVQGPVGRINVEFQQHLLVEAVPR